MALLSSAVAPAAKGADVHPPIFVLIVPASTLCVPLPAYGLGRVRFDNPFEFGIPSDNGLSTCNQVFGLAGALLGVGMSAAAAENARVPAAVVGHVRSKRLGLWRLHTLCIRAWLVMTPAVRLLSAALHSSWLGVSLVYRGFSGTTNSVGCRTW
jgi:hypothetical protein